MPDDIKPDEVPQQDAPQEDSGHKNEADAVATDEAPVETAAVTEQPAAGGDNASAEAENDEGEPDVIAVDEEADSAESDDAQASEDGDDFPDLSDVRIEETMANQVEFQQLDPSPPGMTTGGNIELLLDVKMPIAIELGRTELPISEILSLGPGSVVELDKLAGEPVDLLVNDKIVAKGEVVVVDENFGVRITMLMSPEERLKSLN